MSERIMVLKITYESGDATKEQLIKVISECSAAILKVKYIKVT